MGENPHLLGFQAHFHSLGPHEALTLLVRSRSSCQEIGEKQLFGQAAYLQSSFVAARDALET